MIAYKDKQFADELVIKVQQKRKDWSKTRHQLSVVELDYLFMHEAHAFIDAELVDLGESFIYLFYVICGKIKCLLKF